MTKSSSILKNIALCSILLLLFACGKQEKPNSVQRSEPKVSLTVNGKPIETTQELTTTEGHINGNRIELESPYIDMKFPESMSGKEVTAEVKKLTHTDKPTCGITSVCLDNCAIFPTIQESHRTTFKVEAGRTYYVSMHYGITLDEQATPTPSMLTSQEWLRAESSETYKVEMTIKHGDKELIKLTFAYTPKILKKGEAPSTPPPALADTPKDSESTEPTPPAAPADPTPTPAPPTTTPPIAPAPSAPAPVVPAPPMVDPMPPAPSGSWPTTSNVLVMDFSGQYCPHCPGTVAQVEEWTQKYKGVLPVVLHPFNGMSRVLYHQDAAQYQNNLTYRHSVPQTYLNNRKGSGTRAYFYEVENAINQAPLVQATASARYQRDNNHVEITYRARTKDNSQQIKEHAKVSVLFWLVENDIEAYFHGKGSSYKHQHVFRGVMKHASSSSASYLWGEDYQLDSDKTGFYQMPQVNTYYSDINKRNCHVVAILLDSVTHEFIDAISVPLQL